MTKVLVTGGVRSGKSRYAEALLAGHQDVLYVAPGPAADPDTDPEWAARVRAHRERRPSGWRTHETSDVAAVLRDADAPVLVDCLGTWLTATLDSWYAWHQPQAAWSGRFDDTLDDLCDAWTRCGQPAIAVSNEVGWGVVPPYPSGRLFADLLGRVNARLAALSDDVVLMVAGRPLHLPDPAAGRS